MVDDLLTVAEAAARLGVSARRVRAMIDSGQLEARKLGGRWLVDPAAVDARQDAAAVAGRPLSVRSAWALLGGQALPRGDSGRSAKGSSDRLLRWRTDRRLGRAPVGELLTGLAPRLWRRGRLHRLRAHPSDVSRILEEPDVVRSGVSAAAEYEADILAPGVAELYVSARRLPELRQKYLLESSRTPNVLLRAIEGSWPFPAGSRLAPPSAVALDLLEAEDERTRRAGRELLARLERWPE